MLNSYQTQSNTEDFDGEYARSCLLNGLGDDLTRPWFGTHFVPPADTIYPIEDFSLQNPPLGIDQLNYSSNSSGSTPSLLFIQGPLPPSSPSPLNTSSAIIQPVTAVNTMWKLRCRQATTATCEKHDSSNNDNYDYNNDNDTNNQNINNNDHNSNINSKADHIRKEDQPSRYRLRVREKNRMAARKCRIRQRKAVSQLTVEYESLKDIDMKLRATLNDLEAEIYVLKNMLIEHGNCGCELIQQYLRDAAAKVVQEMRSSDTE